MRLWHWLVWRTTGRCYAHGCGLPLILHSHKRLMRCIHTPLSIQLLDIEPDDSWQIEPVVPVSHAQA